MQRSSHGLKAVVPTLLAPHYCLRGGHAHATACPHLAERLTAVALVRELGLTNLTSSMVAIQKVVDLAGSQFLGDSATSSATRCSIPYRTAATDAEFASVSRRLCRRWPGLPQLRVHALPILFYA